MSLKKTTRKHHSTMTELNITPLLDLVFVLLVIFIITTPQLVNNLEINLPSGKPPKEKPKVEPTRIEVGGQGQITLDQVPVTASELKGKLSDLKAANPDLGVVVKGADDTDYQVMVKVLDTLRQLEITKMGMATE
ncbi:MAG TPA: biopolymer transporter ExbD [Verrucomicrobiae bacterium]